MNKKEKVGKKKTQKEREDYEALKEYRKKIRRVVRST